MGDQGNFSLSFSFRCLLVFMLAYLVQSGDIGPSVLKQVSDHEISMLEARQGDIMITSQKTNNQWMNANDQNLDHHHHHIIHDHANTAATTYDLSDPSLKVFIRFENLKMGHSLLIDFPHRALSSSPILSKKTADSIPFSFGQIPQILQTFSAQLGSPQAQAIEDTLRECERPPIRGETKMCATSLESTTDFTQTIFGKQTQIQAIRTVYHAKSTPTSESSLQNYTIMEVPQEVSQTKMVACHTMPYPYLVLYCHHQVSKSKVFRVALEGEDGAQVEALVVCHLDTSAWWPGHVSFRMLGLTPGSAPVCHFFPEDHFVFVPILASM